MKKNVIITFDYEVFLGINTGTTENCVITPTHLILSVLKENNATAIFFIDAAWLLFMKENFYKDFQRIADQLRDIKESGSTIELHLHPQWKMAYRNDKEIVFKTFNNYSLHSLSFTDIEVLFKQSIDLIESIINQKIKCFRAGGFCIEPFSRIKNIFEKFNIKYDFSVVPGSYLNDNKPYDYNFSDAPRLPFYKFQNDIKKPDQNGHFIEVPLSTYKNNPVYRLLNMILIKLKSDKIFGDGQGIQYKSISVFKTLKRRLNFSSGLFTLDKTSHLIFKYILNTHFRNSNLIVIISHPKTLSEQALKNLKYITKKYKTLNSFDLDDFFKT